MWFAEKYLSRVKCVFLVRTSTSCGHYAWKKKSTIYKVGEQQQIRVNEERHTGNDVMQEIERLLLEAFCERMD